MTIFRGITMPPSSLGACVPTFMHVPVPHSLVLSKLYGDKENANGHHRINASIGDVRFCTFPNAITCASIAHFPSISNAASWSTINNAESQLSLSKASETRVMHLLSRMPHSSPAATALTKTASNVISRVSSDRHLHQIFRTRRSTKPLY